VHKDAAALPAPSGRGQVRNDLASAIILPNVQSRRELRRREPGGVAFGLNRIHAYARTWDAYVDLPGIFFQYVRKIGWIGAGAPCARPPPPKDPRPGGGGGAPTPQRLAATSSHRAPVPFTHGWQPGQRPTARSPQSFLCRVKVKVLNPVHVGGSR
jgi:hypothetical protein